MARFQDLAEITQRDLMGHIARRRNGRTNATVNRELNSIVALWNRAARARYDVGEVPDWKALRLKTTRRAHRILAAEEESPLLEAVRADVRPAIQFILQSGWRRAEALGLRWTDCDLAAQTATTKIKGGDRITRPLTSAMVALIADQPRFAVMSHSISTSSRTKSSALPL